MSLYFRKANKHYLTVHLFCQGTKLFFIFSPPLVYIIETRAIDNSLRGDATAGGH